MKSKNRILENPTTTIVIVVSIICLIVGAIAINPIISFIIVGLIDGIYFKDSIIKLIHSIKEKTSTGKKKEKKKDSKKTEKKKEKKKENLKIKPDEKAIYEYKVGDEIISTGDDSMKKKKEKPKKEKKKKNIGWKIFQWFLLFCCFCFIAGVIVVIAFCSYIVKTAPEFKPEALYASEPSKIYGQGQLIATLGTQNREIITYVELPEVFINALVATEDSQFFQHNGIDLGRFLVASVKQVLGLPGAGGASTLTMQLSKNTYTNKTSKGLKGIIRKFQDVYIAVFQIEPTYTKEQIIEFYVNTNQLGSRYGVEAASQLYFKKSARDMNVSESALLAGMFQAPSALNPLINPEGAEERRQLVLYYMRRHGYITQEEYDIALKMTVDKIVKATDDTDTSSADEIEDVYRSAIDTIVAEVKETTGKDPRHTSMNIYTTIDPKIQKHVGSIMTGDSYKWENDKVQAGVAVVNIKNGTIVAIGGNRDNKTNNVLNHATVKATKNYTLPQIGSTAKPLYDYAPAIEYLNWSTGTVIADEKITYSNGKSINNWDGKFNGFNTIRTQLKLSRNIPALKTFQKLDKNKISTFVTKLGLHPDNQNGLYESHSIGGYNGENPLTMAAAYAAFGNGGYYTEPYVVEKIVFTDTGETKIFSKDTDQVMSSATAYMITSILQDAAAYGIDSGSYGNINGVKYAGKTGTTNFAAEDFKKFKLASNAVRDYWAVGYNTEYSIAVWYGYDSAHEGYNRLGSKQHTRLFQAVAKGIFTNKDNFTMPSTVKKVKIEKDSATLMLPSEFTPDDYIIEELFVAGTEPTTESTRFSKLSDVSNLSATVNGGMVTLSWEPITTPDAFNKEYLTKLNQSAYDKSGELEKYVNSLISKNKNILGTLGYNVYVQTENGLTLLGWTDKPTYTVTGQNGNITLVVKSCYSNFKDNMSNGKNVNVTVNGGYQPPIIDDPNNSNINTDNPSIEG